MNPNRFEYLIVLLLSLSVPFLLTFHPKAFVRMDLKKILTVLPIVAIPWLVWDVWATSRGHWAFNDNYILGFKIINLPIEEILFFLVIPYSSIFLWTVIRDFVSWKDFWQKLTTLK
jgi:lycopene cyclase domain-containing protein